MKYAQVIAPPGQAERFEKLGYASAVKCGPFVLVSGQVGVTEQGVEPEPEAQIRLVFDKIRVLLEQAGGGLEHIVELRSFHVDLDHHRELFMRIYAEYFPQAPFPAITGMIEVKALAIKGLIIEVAATAYLGPEAG